MKTFIITETAVYEIEAEDEADARERFEQRSDPNEGFSHVDKLTVEEV